MAIITNDSRTAMDTIRVVVADARGPERLRCRAELDARTGCTVVAEAVNAGQAVAVAGFERPDVVVLGTDLPNEDGINLLAELQARSPQSFVLVDLAEGAGLADAVHRAVGF